MAEPAGAAAEGAPKVEAQAGALNGHTRDGVDAFLGIPYALPPVGADRWRPPQPFPSWEGVRAARAYGNDCPQQPIPGDATPSMQPRSEDCLTLNVWRPQGAAALPVMVWIHGGGFVMGSSTSPALDGSALARRGIVLVSFNYRIGRFGFFAHPALAAESGGEPAVNFALLDMIAALRWVRANIAAFGGDPANVTLFGESAGGAAVDFLLASPTAQGLFAKAIVQSGANREPYARRATDRPGRISAEKAGVAFAAQAGLKDPDAAALRALPADTVQGGLALYDMQADRFTGGPIVDGTVVPDDPVERFAAGLVPRIPFIVGSNGAELSQEPYAPLLMAMIEGQLPPEAFAALKLAYGDPPSPSLIDDYFFAEAARFYARSMARNGAPAWRYMFDQVVAGRRRLRSGATHASELAYLFDTMPADADAADRDVARMMGDYWTNFAKSGDPNGPGLPQWPSPGEGDPLLVLRDGAAVAGPDPNAARLDAVARAAAARPR